MKLNKTKIVATLGPASRSETMLKRLLKAGVDVFRVNFSHATYIETAETIGHIRKLSADLKIHASILGDLQGPKIRLGEVKENIIVKKGNIIEIHSESKFEGDEKKVFINYANFPKDVKTNEKILINDGKLILKVLETNNKNLVKAKVLQGGPLESRKGVNLPNTNISLPALTTKDKEDALFAIKQELDWIALSFVRSKKDITELEKLIAENSSYKIPIIAKIEKPEAIENMDGIIKKADGGKRSNPFGTYQPPSLNGCNITTPNNEPAPNNSLKKPTHISNSP